MSQWFVLGSGDGTDPKPLVDRILLVEVSNGTERALAFLLGSAYYPATVVNGLPVSAKVTGALRSYVPQTKAVKFGMLPVLDVYSGQPLAVLPRDAKLRLRYIDQRGVPWNIEGTQLDSTGYFKPAEGFDKNVIAWTSHYYGSDGVAVEADTLDEVKAQIRRVQGEQLRNPPPTFDDSTALSDDQGPLVVQDEYGDFRLHGVDLQGRYTIWAVRTGAFQNDVVGPASSLNQIKSDVAAYRQDVAKAPTFGLSPFDAPAAETSTSRLSVDEETATSPELAVATQERTNALRWQTAMNYALAGLLIYAAFKWDQSRGR